MAEFNILEKWKSHKYKIFREANVRKKLIHPLLEEFGWNLKNDRFTLINCGIDIALKSDNNVNLAIECKNVFSSEFKINKECGKFEDSYFEDYSNNDCQFIKSDGIAQLRRYCVQLSNGNNIDQKFHPVITNGIRWIIFKKEYFLNSEKFTETISSGVIEFDKFIFEPNFQTELSNKIKKCNFT